MEDDGRGEGAVAEAEARNNSTIRDHVCMVHYFPIYSPPLILRMTVLWILFWVHRWRETCRDAVLGSEDLKFNPALPSAFIYFFSE